MIKIEINLVFQNLSLKVFSHISNSWEVPNDGI